MNKNWIMPGGAVYKWYEELLSQKHLMIAGATGSGKSVILNGMIYEALLRAPSDIPGGASFILIDPKRVELCQYRALPHVLRYASEPDEMYAALQFTMDLTEQRYRIMQRAGKRLYNGSDVYILIDEFADLMTTQGKRIKPLIQRLAQIGRAARVHIVLCTQCPLAEVIPTKIKVNFDSVIGLHTVCAQDSRNILRQKGCEDLPKYGEALYKTPSRDLTHVQDIPLFPDEVIAQRVKWWTDQTQPAFAWPQRTGFLRRLFKKTA